MSNTIITITGASGSGKSTLERDLCNRFNYKRSVSFTTREPREGEVNGVDYHFISHKQAENLIEEGNVLEYFYFGGQAYGTFIDEVENQNAPVVIVVEPNGLEQIKNYCINNGVNHFCIVLEHDLDVLISRFLSRYKKGGVKPNEIPQIEKRLVNLTCDEQLWTKLISSNIMKPSLIGRYESSTEKDMLETIKSRINDFHNCNKNLSQPAL